MKTGPTITPKSNLEDLKKTALYKQIMKGRKLTPEQERILEERRKIGEFWVNLKPIRRRKIMEIEKNLLLREIKDNHRHVCSCSVCGRKRAFIDKEIERLFGDYCKELEHRAVKPEDRSNFDLIRQRIIDAKKEEKLDSQTTTTNNGKNVKLQFNDKTIEFKENSIVLKQQISKGPHKNEFDEIEVSKDDYLSWNFGRNLIIVNGQITLTTEWLENNKGNVLDILSRLEQIERQDGFLMYPSVHHKKEAAERLERIKMERLERLEKLERKEKERARAKREEVLVEPIPVKEETKESKESTVEGEGDDDDEEYDDSEEYEDEEDEDEDDEETGDAEFQEEERWRESRRMFRLYTSKLLFRTIILAYKDQIAHDLQKKLIDEEEKSKKEDKSKKKGKNEKKNKKEVKGKKGKKGKIIPDKVIESEEEEEEEKPVEPVEEEEEEEEVEEEEFEEVEEEIEEPQLYEAEDQDPEPYDPPFKPPTGPAPISFTKTIGGEKKRSGSDDFLGININFLNI